MPTTPEIHFTPSTLITEEPPKRAVKHSHNLKQIEGHAWSSTQTQTTVQFRRMTCIRQEHNTNIARDNIKEDRRRKHVSVQVSADTQNAGKVIEGGTSNWTQRSRTGAPSLNKTLNPHYLGKGAYRHTATGGSAHTIRCNPTKTRSSKRAQGSPKDLARSWSSKLEES